MTGGHREARDPRVLSESMEESGGGGFGDFLKLRRGLMQLLGKEAQDWEDHAAGDHRSAAVGDGYLDVSEPT